MDNNNQSITASAGKVSGATAISRILGLIREQVMAFFFGAGLATDAFVAAFRIPNLLRDLFAEGALSSAFIPVFKDKMVKSGKEEAMRLACLTISGLILIVGIIIAIGIIFAPQLVYLSAAGFKADPYKFNLTVSLTQVMFIYLLMVSISAVFMGILNSFGHFGVPALSPAMFNIGMIITPVVLYSYFDTPIYTMAIGVLIGGIGQLIFQVPSLFKIGFKFKLKIDFADEGIRRIGRLISPMVIGLSASRINILINTLLASLLVEGAMSYLNYAYRLMHFPLGVFGVALGTVALPKFSEQAATNNIEQLASTFYEAIGLAFFLVIPSAVYLAGYGDDLIRLIYQRGAFTPEATLQTARALYFYAFGLLGFAGVRVAAPLYYALGDAKRPMYYSIIAVMINITLNFALIPYLGFAGLAAATSAAGLSNLILLILNMDKKIGRVNYKYLLSKVIIISLASLAAYFFTTLINFEVIFNIKNIWGKIAVVLIQISIMGGIYFMILWLLKIPETKKLISIVKRK